MAADPSTVRRALIVLDGLGDRPDPSVGGVTPTEAAATPHLDRLSTLGRLGAVQLLGPGVAPESDAGVFALLGYDPRTESPGRGVLEAEGVGVTLAPGDVALRLNFATTDGAGLILDSRVGRSLGTEESRQLAEALTRADLLAPEGIEAVVRATVGHRGVLWLHPRAGEALSPEISNADPFYERVGGMGQARSVDSPHVREVVPLEPTAGATRAARAVNDFLARAAPQLAEHPVNARRALRGRPIANSLLVRNAGGASDRRAAPFQEIYHLEGGAVTEMPVERGIARWLGLRDRFVGPMGSDRDASLKDRARATRELLAEVPFLYVHLKGPDEPGHDGNAPLKRDIIAALDRSFFGPFLEGLDLTTTRLAITADHATPCAVHGHSDDPVPLLLVGAGVAPEPAAPNPAKFGETLAARGSLGRLEGRAVLPLLFAPSVPPR